MTTDDTRDPFIPNTICVGVDPSGGRRDHTGVSVVAGDGSGRYVALSVDKQRLGFASQRRAIRARLDQVTDLYPRTLTGVALDATGSQGALAATVATLLEERYPDRRIGLFAVTLTGGDSLGRTLTRIPDAPSWAYSLSRAAAVANLIHRINTGDLDVTGLPEADKRILEPELAGWRERANGRVDHGSRAGDDALWSLALALVGAEKIQGQIATFQSPLSLAPRGRSAIHKNATPANPIFDCMGGATGWMRQQSLLAQARLGGDTDALKALEADWEGRLAACRDGKPLPDTPES